MRDVSRCTFYNIVETSIDGTMLKLKRHNSGSYASMPCHNSYILIDTVTSKITCFLDVCLNNKLLVVLIVFETVLLIEQNCNLMNISQMKNIGDQKVNNVSSFAEL